MEPPIQQQRWQHKKTKRTALVIYVNSEFVRYKYDTADANTGLQKARPHTVETQTSIESFTKRFERLAVR